MLLGLFLIYTNENIATKSSGKIYLQRVIFLQKILYYAFNLFACVYFAVYLCCRFWIDCYRKIVKYTMSG